MTWLSIPYLKNRGGKIIVVSSAAAWLPSPRMSIYNARLSFYLKPMWDYGFSLSYLIWGFFFFSGEQGGAEELF